MRSGMGAKLAPHAGAAPGARGAGVVRGAAAPIASARDASPARLVPTPHDMPPRVTLATYDRLPALAPDDATLLPALARLGVEADARVWSDADAWRRPPDLVVVRSCWDYHRRLAEFEAWLDRLGAAGVRVGNPPHVLRWNARKRYLLDLAARGVPG